MITKYKITRSSYTVNAIEVVNILRETESCVFLVDYSYRKKAERKELKETDYHGYYDTWEEAHAALLRFSENKLNSARRVLEHAQGHYGNIKGMKKPEAA